MRNTLVGSALLAASLAAGGWFWLSRPAPPAAEVEEGLVPTPGLPWFEDVTAASGIAFRHFDSSTPEYHIQEAMGGGVAWIDYDGDGLLDLFFVQSGPVHPREHRGPPPTHELYRNNGDGTFTDVTRRAGLDHPCFGMGCAVGDFDNDGFDDLVVTHIGGIKLYHNRPDGKGGRRFVDITASAGLADNPHWATSCAWGDVDGDGLLDLYVCNYVELDPANDRPCLSPAAVRHACPPTVFRNTTHRLYRNRGDGTFADVSAASGVAAAPPAPGLGVAMVDLDGDGKIDIYVANDMKPAYLFHNRGGGRFVERAMASGCALEPNARYIAGMGIAVGDFDDTGRPSLFVTNFQDEPNLLFLNRGNLRFHDWTYPSGLGAPSIDRLAFGAVLLDADLDGRFEVAVVNGHITRNSKEAFGKEFAQRAQLFRGEGKAKFRDVSDLAGPYFRTKAVGRGLAWADFDNDGLPDLVVANNGGPPALLRNRTITDNAWLRLELVGDGKKSNRNAIGARVAVEAGGRTQTQFVVGGGSYLSASERRPLFGLGRADKADRVTVVWPSGRRQEFRDLEGRKHWRVIEGHAPVEVARRPQESRRE